MAGYYAPPMPARHTTTYRYVGNPDYVGIWGQCMDESDVLSNMTIYRQPDMHTPHIDKPDDTSTYRRMWLYDGCEKSEKLSTIRGRAGGIMSANNFCQKCLYINLF